MRISRVCLLAASALGLVCAMLPAFAATPSDRRFARELGRMPDGTLGSRYVIDAPPFLGSLPAEFRPAPEPAARPGPPNQILSADTLWTDRVHLNAIPERVAITGDGLNIVAGWWLNSPRTSHYVTTAANGRVPDWTRTLNSLDVIPVDAAFGPWLGYNEFTTAGTADSAYGMNTDGTLFFDDAPPAFYANDLVATCDSAKVVVRTLVNADTTLIQGLSPTSGAVLWTQRVNQQVNGIDVSSDGNVLAATTNSGILMYSGCSTVSPVIRDTIGLGGGSPWPAAVSGDGSLVVAGGYTPFVNLYQWNGSSYVVRWIYNTQATYVTAVDISDDGSTVVAGTLVNTNPPAGTVTMLAANSPNPPTPLWVLTNFGDLISSVSLSAHGQVGAAACWGRKGGTVGYVLCIFDRANWYPLEYALNDDQILGVGSFLSVKMSDNGRYCAAGARVGHARTLGSGGEVFALYAPGEFTSVGDPAPPVLPASAFELGQNAPNPANPNTLISYRVPFEGARVDLAIYDVGGRHVRTLFSGALQSGRQEELWNGRDDQGRSVPSGVYYYRLSGPGFQETRKLVLAH